MQEITSLLNAFPIDPLTGSIQVPIYQTSTFVQSEPGVHKGFDYSRSNNPTRKALEDILAHLEEGHSAFAFASGLAAIDAVAKLLNSGDEIIAVDDIYGGAYRLFIHVYQKFGIKIHFCDTSEVENVAKLINNNTKLIWLESPTNPTLKISDIEAISKLAKSKEYAAQEILVCVDNTFATPVSQKPIKLGADIVIHSATKYLGGHSDLIAGAVVCKTEELGAKIKFIQNATGGILAPFDSFLVLRGIETLHLRFKQHSENAQKIAEYLSNHPAIDKVFYPGLKSHKNHEVAKAQQKYFGGIVSFSLKIDDENLAAEFTSKTELFKLAESLGGVKSLICHPARMTHKSIPKETRNAAGVQDSLIRISVGLEDVEDLIIDLEKALLTLIKVENVDEFSLISSSNLELV